MPFGQIVIGPPGSGKTTYCNGIQQFLNASGRKVVVVNLDPANDDPPYEAAIDLGDLVGIEEVQENMGLGPNGAMIYCMEYLWKNFDWLEEKLKEYEEGGYYFLFDCPGQIELFTLHDSLKEVIHTLANKQAYRLVAVHLIDSHLCSAPNKYISAVLVSLSTMLHLELPHVNVLSKMDLIKLYGDLGFRLDYFMEAQDLDELAKVLSEDESLPKKFVDMSSIICEVVEEFGLVGFTPLAIEDKQSVAHLMEKIDKANGFVFVDLAKKSVYPEFEYVNTAKSSTEMWGSYHEKYIDNDVIEHPTTD